MDVWVTEGQGYGIYYCIWVDGQIYETLNLRRTPRLTWSEQADMADLYREALQEAPYLLQSKRNMAL